MVESVSQDQWCLSRKNQGKSKEKYEITSEKIKLNKVPFEANLFHLNSLELIKNVKCQFSDAVLLT